MFDPPSQPPAGWYPDPHRPGTRRWWDGRQWAAAWDDRYVGGAPSDGSLPEFGTWIGDSFRLGLGRWRASALIGAVTLGTSAFLVGLSFRYLLSDVVITDDDILGWDAGRIPVAVTIVVVGSLLGLVGQLALVVLMLRTVDGERPAPATADEFELGVAALIGALKVLPRAIGWGLVVAGAAMLLIVVVAGLFIVVLPLGVIAVVALIPAMIFVAVRLAFVTHSIVDRAGQPFTRSIEVSRGRFWPVLGRLLLFGVIGWLISGAFSTANSIASGNFGPGFGQNDFEFDDGGTSVNVELADAFPASPLSIVVGVVVATATAVLVSGVGAVALATLYRTVNPRD